MRTLEKCFYMRIDRIGTTAETNALDLLGTPIFKHSSFKQSSNKDSFMKQ